MVLHIIRENLFCCNVGTYNYHHLMQDPKLVAVRFNTHKMPDDRDVVLLIKSIKKY